MLNEPVTWHWVISRSVAQSCAFSSGSSFLHGPVLCEPVLTFVLTWRVYFYFYI